MSQTLLLNNRKIVFLFTHAFALADLSEYKHVRGVKANISVNDRTPGRDYSYSILNLFRFLKNLYIPTFIHLTYERMR